jgi:hypothetical protein
MAVDKQEIQKLLHEYFHISGWHSISDTGLVSITGNVKLQKTCDQLPVRFDRVSGYFDCKFCELKTLAGTPRWIGGYFSCSDNQLETLEGAPQWVSGFFSCSDNQLETLEGAPQWVGNNFYCDNNRLKTLEYSPKWIRGSFWCDGNPLESLKGMPLYIEHQFAFTWKENLPLCRILTSQINNIHIDNRQSLTIIVEKYLNTGYAGMLPFANELIHTGYGDNAWL